MRYWLFKSEPTTFSIDDLIHSTHQTTHWNGVRNYQVRNMLRDEIKVGDLAFFYNSNCAVPAITGTMKIVKAGYPDFTAWDPQSPYYDKKSNPTNPSWFMVDVQFLKKFGQPLSLHALKSHVLLKNMQVTRKGNRLSITPVSSHEWETINRLLSEKK
jgi:predicted RNA-binding protein with PUA-like domain